jgi:hypothetical protein
MLLFVQFLRLLLCRQLQFAKKEKKADAAEIAANVAVLAMPKTATANVKPGLRII